VTQTTGRDPQGLGMPNPVEGLTVVRLPTRVPTRTDRVTERLIDLLHRPWAAEALLGLLSAVLFAWLVNRPSAWWDEAITRDVTSRTSSEILDLAGHVDLVHTTYYLIVHAVLGTSTSVTPIRLVSVVAAALTTVLLVRLGRELGSGRVGVTAAVMWMAAPLASRYAQEARPYAMVALAATAATLALVRVCRRPWLPGRWVIYAATLVAVGLLNVLALVLLAVHLSYVLASSSIVVRRRWYAAAGAAGLLLSPLLVASSNQRGQVAWLPAPDLGRLTGFFQAEYGVSVTVLVLLVVAVAGLGRGTHSPALGLGLAWGVLPPVLLWTVSQAHPLFDWRYVFFALPGLALALGSLSTLLRPRWLVVAVLVVAIGGFHMQQVYRWSATGHAENLRGAADVIAENARSGDAVLFLPASRRVVELGYPEAFENVDDVALATSGADSASLWGAEEPGSDLAPELEKRYRVWVVTGQARFGETADPAEHEKERLLYNGYRLVGVTDVGRYEVRLYERHRKAPVAAVSASAK
jgi:mannosyltransferase